MKSSAGKALFFVLKLITVAAFYEEKKKRFLPAVVRLFLSPRVVYFGETPLFLILKTKAGQHHVSPPSPVVGSEEGRRT